MAESKQPESVFEKSYPQQLENLRRFNIGDKFNCPGDLIVEITDTSLSPLNSFVSAGIPSVPALSIKIIRGADLLVGQSGLLYAAGNNPSKLLLHFSQSVSDVEVNPSKEVQERLDNELEQRLNK